jgi:hypothetical protein
MAQLNYINFAEVPSLIAAYFQYWCMPSEEFLTISFQQKETASTQGQSLFVNFDMSKE